MIDWMKYAEIQTLKRKGFKKARVTKMLHINRETVAKYGIEKESRIGYSTGLNYPPDWGEHTASLRPGDMTVLQPNMVFHCIPGVYYPDFGISISQCFRVTETGCERMSSFPFELIQK